MRYSFYLLSLAFFLISCKKENRFDCFKSTGEITSETRNTSFYDNILINDIFNVLLVQDSTNSIEIIAGKNLIKLINTNVKDSTLFISNNNKCNWARKYKDIELIIHTQDLNSIIINGESTITSVDTLKYNKLSIDVWSHISHVDIIIDSYESHLNVHAGTGDFIFRGKSHLSYLYCHGNARLHANRLISSYSSILNNSTGDIYTNAVDVIHASIQNYGNIYYYGNPVIELERSGSGEMICIN